MCFSASASFISAGITGAIGLATVTQVRTWREAPLAAMPLSFSAQQAIEGALWLTLPHGGDDGLSSALTHAYLGFALAFWPVFAPVAVWLIEREQMRRSIMAACAVIGVGVALHFVYSVLAQPHVAQVRGNHIVYLVNTTSPLSVGGLYLFATGIALMLSSYRAVALMGAIVFLGSIASFYFYYEAYVSVWCFFAAGSSILLFVHFYRQRLAHVRQSPA
jgi:hypothetical protein